MRRGRLQPLRLQPLATARALCCGALGPMPLSCRTLRGEEPLLHALMRRTAAFVAARPTPALAAARWRRGAQLFSTHTAQRAADGSGKEESETRDNGGPPEKAEKGGLAGTGREIQTSSRRATSRSLVSASSAGEEEVVLPTDSRPRELVIPQMPPGMTYWKPKPAPPRVITTPHLDAKLSEPPSKLQKRLRIALFALSIFAIWGVGMVFTDNYVKLKSSIVDGIMFMAKNDEEAKRLLGPHIRFANKHLPWVSGVVQQVKGKVDVSFKVKGDIGMGTIRFVARRKLAKGSRMGEWVTLEFSLTLPSGDKVDISQTPDLRVDEETQDTTSNEDIQELEFVEENVN